MLISTPLPRKFRALLKFTIVRKFLHAIYASDMEPRKWVFVTGCYNSGTTLLARILEADPRINALPGEGARYTTELTRPEDIGWTRMWCMCIDYIKMPPSVQPKKAKLLRRDWSLFYSKGGTINLEKSIVTAPKMPWINANFNDAWFVGIVRCPFAVSKGIQHRAKPNSPTGAPELTEYTMEMTANQWAVANETLATHMSNIPNSVIITYEDLIKNPVDTIQDIYQKIGETPPPLKYTNGSLSISSTTLKIKTEDNKKRRAGLSKEESASVLEVVKSGSVQSLLTKHGIESYLVTEKDAHESNQSSMKGSV